MVLSMKECDLLMTTNDNDNQGKTPKTERQQLEKGYERAIKKEQRTLYGDATATKDLISEYILPVAADIKEEIDHYKGKPSARPNWYEDLHRLDPEQLAAIAVRTMFDAVGAGWSYVHTKIQMGRAVEANVFAIRLKAAMEEIDPNYGNKKFEELEKRTKEKASDLKRRLNYFQWVSVEKGYITGVDMWDDARRDKAATPLINAVLRALDLGDGTSVFVIKKERRDVKSERSAIRKIYFSDAFAEMLEERFSEIRWRSPSFSPMLTKPRRWGEGVGPYNLDELAVKVPLVRNPHGKQKERIAAAIDDGSMRPVLDAIHHLQEVPYIINTFVYEALKWCVETGKHKEIDDFPLLHPPEVPDYPADFQDWEPKKKAAFYRKRERRIKLRDSVPSNKQVLKDDLMEAEGLVGYEFYLPHNLDFRSRVYHVPNFGHHRADHVRALMMFARGSEITQANISYLQMQVANSWGNSVSGADERKTDKLPFVERLNWVKDNQKLILATGADFKAGFPHWSKADNPFQYLAACRELYLAMKAAADGKAHLCHLPIAFDGTNSGLQHMAGACHNASDGHKVNLVPDDTPQDIYQLVAMRSTASVTEDLNTEDDTKSNLAKLWFNFGIDRKVVKRNCMTVPYSSKPRGMSDQIVEDLMNKLADKEAFENKPHPFVDGPTSMLAANYLAAINYQSVLSEIDSIGPVLRFLQELERVMRKMDLHMQWTTPTGFPVNQHYVHNKGQPVYTALFDTEARVMRDNRDYITVPTGRINATESNDGIAPNFTHSMDASHLIMTVNKCREYGVENLMVVHDSFATDVTSCQIMNDCIRAAFVELYIDNNVYADLLHYCQEYAQEEFAKKPEGSVPNSKNPNLITWPEPPELKPKGDKDHLDLMVVMDSLYAFS